MEQIVHIEGQLSWDCAQSRESGKWIGVCEALRLTVQADSYRELDAAIEDGLQLLFADLVRAGDLSDFLKEHGWRAHDPVVIARSPRQLRFSIPHSKKRVALHDLEAAVC